MKNPIALIVGIISLLMTGLCCVGGIGFAVWGRMRQQAAPAPQTFAPPGIPTQPGVPTPPGVPGVGGAINSGQLLLGQAQSNYGATAIVPGVDPAPIAIVSGATQTNSVTIGDLTLNPLNSGSCRGFTTFQPDHIVNITAPLAALNFAITTADGGDTTLIIHNGGRFWCSDDDGGNLNPLIRIEGATPGQYDVWVGSYSAGANVQTSLALTQR